MSKCLLIMHSRSGCKVKKVTAIGGPPGIVGKKTNLSYIKQCHEKIPCNSCHRKQLRNCSGAFLSQISPAHNVGCLH